MGSSASKKNNAEPAKDNSDPKKDKNNNKKEKKTKISHEGSGPYDPYTEFPDIQRMREAQNDFKESTYDIDNDDENVPLPFPPIVTREEIYKKYNFVGIDIRVHDTPSSLTRDVDQLVEYICRDTKDDIEKVRALFSWVSSRDRANSLPELTRGPPPSGSPLDHLVNIMNFGQTYEYNTLFATLCKAAKIPYKTVLGKIRASAKELGGPVSSNGTYFMVYVEDNWHFIHPHWGSCYVKSFTSQSDWLLIEGVQGQKSGLATGATPNQLAFAREDFWFFTNPEVIAHFFLSVQDDHQLLARPIKQQEFQLMARLYQPFFTREFTSVSPPRCMSRVDEDFTVEVGLPKKGKMEFDYGVFKRALDTSWKAPKDFRRLAFMERIDGKLRVKFNLPHIGVFKFEVSCHETHTPTSNQTLCEYLIDNQTPNFSCQLNPTNNLNEWGAGPKAQEVGLEPEKEGGLIEAEEGKAMVKFRLRITDKKKLKFNYKLQDEKGNTEDLKDFVRHSNTDDKSSVIIRTPQHGKYVLRVQAKDESEKDYQDICNYLVTSDRGVADDTPFPKAPNGQIGPLEKEKITMEPISHRDPIIEEVPKGHIEIKMKESGDFEVLPKLMLDNQNRSEYVYQYKKSKEERVYVLFLPTAGWFSFKIFARRRGSDDDHQLYFTYVVIAKEPKESCVPFPQLLSAWKDDFVIIEPQEGQLPQNKRQRFRIKIPGAEGVTLKHGQNEIKLHKVNLKNLDDSKDIKTDDNEKDDDEIKNTKKDTKTASAAITSMANEDVWEAEMDTGTEESQIKILVSQKGKSEEMVLYKVLSSDENEHIQKLQKEADLDAIRKRERIENKAKEEERNAENRKRKSEKKVEARKEDFSKNKDKYLQKQRQLDDEALKKEKNQFPLKEFEGRAEKKKNERQLKQKVEPTKREPMHFNLNGKPPETNRQNKVIDGQKAPHTSREEIKIKHHTEDRNRDSESDKQTYRELIKQKKMADEELRKNVSANEEAEKTAEERDLLRKRTLEMPNETGDWKEMQVQIAKEMRLEKLREAIRSRDKDRLETAIQEAKDHGVAQDDELIIKAEKELDIVIVRNELRESLQKREPDAIKACIQKIFDSNFYYSRLQPDVADALQVLERLQRTLDMRVDHLEIKSALFSELRRYNKPPKIVHEVIQATLLLFNEDEEKTSNWVACQQHLNPSGANSMHRKILDFDSSKVHPEVAARCKEILEQYEIHKVREASPAAATFYAWSMGSVESLVPEGKDVKPASIRRQCELFGYPKDSPRKKRYDFKFSMRKDKEKTLDGSTRTSSPKDIEADMDDEF